MLANLFRQLLKSSRPGPQQAHWLGNELASAIRLQQSGAHAQAESIYRAVLERNPDHADALHLLGCNLIAQRRLDEAIAVLLRVSGIDPACAEAHYNLAGAYSARGDPGSALKSYGEALRLRPDFVEAHHGVAGVLRLAGNHAEAESCYRKALALRPAFAEGHYNLGNLLHFLGRADEAIASYRNAIEIDPHFVAAHSNLLYMLNCQPGYLPQAIYHEHLAWAERHAEPLMRLAAPHDNAPHAERRLRVGYVSPDFKDHSVTYFFEPVLTHHKRSDFEVWCYYVDQVRDGASERLRELAGHWVECVRWTDEELAQRIRKDRIDILVDLAGHTGANRLLVFARKPAPVQVTYLGYPTSTGLSAINYRLTDWQVDPAGAEAFNAEQPVRLPYSYFCYRAPQGCPEVGRLPALQAGHITFGSFNHSAKMSERVLELWSQVLKAVPGAVLMLKAKSLADARMRERIRQQFARLGVAAERLLLQGWEAETANHLALYNKVDIAVDTYPYNGATTTCEALWMGVPVVTLRGPTHASRMGASLLTAAGLGELIAATPERYVETCVELAADLARLEAMRVGLRARVRDSALMDEAGFTRALETEYRRMWRAWCVRQTLEQAVRTG